MDKVRYFKLGVKMSKKDKLDEVTQELWRQMPKFSKTKTIRVIICLILSLNISFKSNSQNQVDIRQHLNNPETLAKLYFNYIVRVVSYDKEGNSLGWGNGCFIDSTGDIITARHVLLIPNTHNAYIMVVSGEYFPITQIIAEDIEADLIRASTNISQYYKINSNLKIDSAFIPKLHDSVYYFGWTPLPETIADTLLSEHERVIFKTGAIGTFKGTIINIEQNESDESIFFWTSINIYQGNSGGPLFNKNGKIIGIAHATPNIAMIKESELEMNKTYGIFTSINAALNLKANKGIEYLEWIKEHEAEALWGLGRFLFTKGELDSALYYFNEAITLDSLYEKEINTICSGAMLHGIEKLKNNNLSKAILFFDMAIKLDSKKIDAYINRGVAKITLGYFQSAIQDFDTAIKLDPENAIAYHYRGSSYLEIGNFDEAIKDLNISIELKIDSCKAYYHRGLAKYMKGYSYEAIKDFTEAIQINPNLYDAYYYRSMINLELENFTEIISDCDIMIKLNSSDADAYIFRGIAKAEKDGSPSKGLPDLDKAIALEPNNVMAYFNRAKTNTDLSNFHEALKDYNKAIELDSTYAMLYYGRGNARHKIGNYLEALYDYNIAIIRNPNYTIAYTNRGIVKLILEDKEGGCSDLKKGSELGDEYALQLIEEYCK